MNSSENGPTPAALGRAAEAVRAMIEHARQAVLASLLPNGAPYASLVNVANAEGAPILLLSRLAWHTRNILADDRACLLISEEAQKADALDSARVSLIGRVAPVERTRVEARYFLKHPKARSYARFDDFSFYRLNVETAHYVAGFGRIITMERAQLFPPHE